MKKGFIEPCAKINYYTDDFINLRCLFILFFFLFQKFSFAQELKSPELHGSQAVIFIHGATIHSEDESFNKQIANKAELKNVEIDQTLDGQLNVIARSHSKEIKELPSDKTLLREKEIIASKKREEIEAQLPKKEIIIHINKVYEGDEFLAKNGSISDSYIFPSNDFSSSEDFVLIESKIVTQSLDYLHSDSFFYQNNLVRLIGFISGFSVRPPPYSI